jgi:glyoxylase-like metal-dependent hydrolase (beta-lactamase superfamily II)
VEIAPGIHRIESDLGPRFMCQYVLVGDNRVVLVDTGLASTPDDVIVPYLEDAGLEPNLVLISHADLDHCGGNLRLRKRYPHALFACHELDRRWIESNEAMLRENYMWHEAHGFPAPDREGQAEMLASLGGDAPIDVGLRGDETICLGTDRLVDVLHLPGHTHGHLGLWDRRTRAAIIIDAVLYDGIYDRAGNKLIPPRYYDLRVTRETIARVLSLEPALLLTAHYAPLSADEARAWLERSLRFVDEFEQIVREEIAGGTTDLWELTKRADAQLGPYPEFMTELGAGAQYVLNST